MGSHAGPESTGTGSRAPAARSRGSALLELALVLPVLIILALGVIDFGRLIQTRLIVTNLAREGGSLASRQPALDPQLMTMLQSSGTPLDMTGANARIYVSRIQAGTATGAAAAPTLAAQLTGGSLGRASAIGAARTRLGLSSTIYGHLTYRDANRASDLSEVTVVEVYYKYHPITPLPAFILRDVLLHDDGNGLVVWSRSIF